MQNPKETFIDILQGLTSAVARKVLMESLAFENENTEYKEII